ncbi:hypothetical protein ATI61_104201 [Archangium gephyra]|uniref:Uncharacterized protein n=1 Tax=Archangium gephyra TaxID=48 RepID=A0ABX9K4Q8_9BACT|nr:hypothetical protein ATI61_104201 [Archangium gephyra]
MALVPANDIGYLSQYDDLLFASVGKVRAGCKAGLSVLGIHVEGGITPLWASSHLAAPRISAERLATKGDSRARPCCNSWSAEPSRPR